MDFTRDLREGRYSTPSVATGLVFGLIAGSVLLAITQNPVWVGLGIPFGAALGAVVGAVMQTNQR